MPQFGRWFKHVVKAAKSGRRSRGSSKSFFRPSIEKLEDRVLFAVRIWTGTDVPNPVPMQPIPNGDPRWSDPVNWQPVNGVSGVPQNGDDVIFPQIPAANMATPTSGALGDLSQGNSFVVNSINDLSTPGHQLVLNSIEIQASGYVIREGSSMPAAFRTVDVP